MTTRYCLKALFMSSLLERSNLFWHRRGIESVKMKMNVCQTFPERVLDLDPLLRLSSYRDGYSQYLEEHLVSWRGRANSFRTAIRRLTRAEDPRSSHPLRVAQVMSFFGWREHREYVMHRKRPPCVGLPRRLAANIIQCGYVRFTSFPLTVPRPSVRLYI